MNTIHGEWVRCKDCIHFEDCDTKEGRDGCYFGDPYDGIKLLKYPKDAPRKYFGFDPNIVITKSHSEGDITVVDEFKLTDVSIAEAKE